MLGHGIFRRSKACYGVNTAEYRVFPLSELESYLVSSSTVVTAKTHRGRYGDEEECSHAWTFSRLVSVKVSCQPWCSSAAWRRAASTRTPSNIHWNLSTNSRTFFHSLSIVFWLLQGYRTVERESRRRAKKIKQNKTKVTSSFKPEDFLPGSNILDSFLLLSRE